VRVLWKAHTWHLGLNGKEDNFQSEIGRDRSFFKKEHIIDI
jgi:hypothetical protein